MVVADIPAMPGVRDAHPSIDESVFSTIPEGDQR
jgi:hypothetical protein